MYSSYYSTPTYGSSVSAGTDFGVWGIVSIILALIGGILLYFLFVNSKNEPKGKFLTWLKDFLAFKIMWIEPIMKVVYYVATIFCVLVSFSLISTSFLAFIIMFLVSPIVIRIIYEAFMMMIMIWRNTRDIARNTEKK